MILDQPRNRAPAGTGLTLSEWLWLKKKTKKQPPRTVSPFVPLMADAIRARGIYSAPDQTQIARMPAPAFQAGSRETGDRK